MDTGSIRNYCGPGHDSHHYFDGASLRCKTAGAPKQINVVVTAREQLKTKASARITINLDG